MLRITVEVVNGDRREVAALNIGNDLSGTRDFGNYNVAVFNEDGNRTWVGRVEGHRRDLGALSLVYKALMAASTDIGWDALRGGRSRSTSPAQPRDAGERGAEP